jgi:hypothetical protein
MEINMELSQKLKIELPFDPAIPSVGKHPKESKSEFCSPCLL